MEDRCLYMFFTSLHGQPLMVKIETVHGYGKEIKSQLLKFITTNSDFPPYCRGVYQNLNVAVSAMIRLVKSDKKTDTHGESLLLTRGNFKSYLGK